MQGFGRRNQKYFSIFISCSFLLVLMIGFQNCQKQRNIIDIASQSAINEIELLLLPDGGSRAVRILADDFDVNSSVTFTVEALKEEDQAEFEKYTNFEWFISLYDLYEDLDNLDPTFLNQDDNEKRTDQANYKWSFNEIGVYNISVDMTALEGVLPITIGRNIVIGQCTNSPLEIDETLSETVGSEESTSDDQTFEVSSLNSTTTTLPLNKVLFSVDSVDGEVISINNGLWEVRHNGQRIESHLFSFDQYISLTLIGLEIVEEDNITLEFFTQLEGENCITYSEKSYQMTDGILLALDEDESPLPTTTTMTIDTSTTTTSTPSTTAIGLLPIPTSTSVSTTVSSSTTTTSASSPTTTTTSI